MIVFYLQCACGSKVSSEERKYQDCKISLSGHAFIVLTERVRSEPGMLNLPWKETVWKQSVLNVLVRCWDPIKMTRLEHGPLEDS